MIKKVPGTVRTAQQMVNDFTPGLSKHQQKVNLDWFKQIAAISRMYAYPDAQRTFTIDENNNFVEQ